MNPVAQVKSLRWTLLSFAAIGIVVWVSTVVLVQAALPTITNLIGGVSTVLDSSAASVDESAVAAERGTELVRGIEPALTSTAEGLESAAASLAETQDAVAEMAELFSELGVSLQAAGTAMSRTAGLQEPGRSVTDAGMTMSQVSSELTQIIPKMDGLRTSLLEVQVTVSATTDGIEPFARSLDRTGASLLQTSDSLRTTAAQLEEVRNSASLQTAVVMVFVLLGVISVSLAVIAGSRLTQLGLVQQVAETAVGVPQSAAGTVRRVGQRIEREVGRGREGGAG